ncbi:MAG TPA: hypothetical protein VNL77_10540 [Roseiflexaceae bacterium]|nr:hypothetical protein [Roseiflexaceae bacterium]
MKPRAKSSVRKGRVYRFTIEGTEYAAFIWQVGKQFRGCLDDQPQAPEQRGTTAAAVCAALSAWLLEARATS